MGVVTKTGDTGDTARFGGARIPKHHPSVVANGDVDELNSAIGMLAALATLPSDIGADLIIIQERCFVIGAELATLADAAVDVQTYIPRIDEQDIELLEQRISFFESQLSPQKSFLLPGGCQAASLAFWVRTVARRAERSAVAYAAQEDISPLVVKYLNRLSDYFYILGRYCNFLEHTPEVPWNGGSGELPAQDDRRQT